jgi:hypothetical protein
MAPINPFKHFPNPLKLFSSKPAADPKAPQTAEVSKKPAPQAKNAIVAGQLNAGIRMRTIKQELQLKGKELAEWIKAGSSKENKMNELNMLTIQRYINPDRGVDVTGCMKKYDNGLKNDDRMPHLQPKHEAVPECRAWMEQWEGLWEGLMQGNDQNKKVFDIFSLLHNVPNELNRSNVQKNNIKKDNDAINSKKAADDINLRPDQHKADNPENALRARLLGIFKNAHLTPEQKKEQILYVKQDIEALFNPTKAADTQASYCAKDKLAIERIQQDHPYQVMDLALRLEFTEKADGKNDAAEKARALFEATKAQVLNPERMKADVTAWLDGEVKARNTHFKGKEANYIEAYINDGETNAILPDIRSLVNTKADGSAYSDKELADCQEFIEKWNNSWTNLAAKPLNELKNMKVKDFETCIRQFSACCWKEIAVL